MSGDMLARALIRQGYIVIPEFLGRSDTCQELIDYLRTSAKFHDGVINDIPSSLMQGVSKRLKDFLPAVISTLGLSVSHDHYGYSAIRIHSAKSAPRLRRPFNIHQDPKVAPGGVLNWHLDHFSYYLHQDHKNWLICYMPIVKPSRDLANLAIVPKDVLAEHDPELSSRIAGRGAMRFRKVEGDTKEWFQLRFPDQEISVGDWFAIDDFDDARPGWKINIDLEQCKVVPKLAEGDLLLMMADVIHRTNDAGSDRISLRCDAIPAHAPRRNSVIGLLILTLSYPFTGAKRRYNLRYWLKMRWKKVLLGDVL